MTPKEFFDLVDEMRMMQRSYFKTRDRNTLDRSKRLEDKVDNEIIRVKLILKRKQEQNDTRND